MPAFRRHDKNCVTSVIYKTNARRIASGSLAITVNRPSATSSLVKYRSKILLHRLVPRQLPVADPLGHDRILA